MSGLPPANWPLTTGETITPPWYNYFRAADETWRVRLTVATTTGTNVIPNNGITEVRLTSTTTHTLAPPEVGCRNVLIWTGPPGSSAGRVATPSTSIIIISSPGHAGGWILSFASTAALIEMVGLSTSRYHVVANSGVTVSTV